jgi:DNA end-binding protein Ku
MPRAVWKGQIAFGLVSVPVTLHSAEERVDIQFRLLDARDKARVRYERVNEITGREVPWDQVVKGYELDDDNYVVVTDGEIKDAAPQATQTVQIEDFVSADEIDPVYFEKPYYLVPEKRGEKGYALLRETMRRTKTVGIARVVIRTREYLAALLVSGDRLMLDLLRFEQEIKDPKDFEVPGRDLEAAKISKKEIDMATKLVESMTVPWKPERYKDEFRANLLDWLQKKAEKGDGDELMGGETKAKPSRGRVVNFMDLLEKSLGAKRGGGAASAHPAREKAPKAKSSRRAVPKGPHLKRRKRA